MMAKQPQAKSLALRPTTTSGVLVSIQNPRIDDTGDVLNFDIQMEYNSQAPAETITATHLVKSTKASYITLIRNAVKAKVLANEGVTLTNADIIIWPLLE